MKSINAYLKKFPDNKNIIEAINAAKLKGGKTSKKYIWNGCGGIIPQ